MADIIERHSNWRTWTGSGMAMIGPSQIAHSGRKRPPGRWPSRRSMLLLNNSTPRSRGGMNLYRCRSLKAAVESFMS